MTNIVSAIRILLADDHTLVRAGFRSLLEKLGFQVVGEAENGAQSIRLVESLRPNIVLMDIAMPDMNGLEATAQIVQNYPGVNVIILSMHATPEYARRAVRAGAAGYLLKDASAAEFDQSLQAVMRGEVFLSPRISKFIVSDYVANSLFNATPLDNTTARQREILQLIVEGNSRKAISEKLNISVKTVDTYRAQLMDQLDIHDTAGLVRFAVNFGLIPRDKAQK
jgi:DNA-binding NarL/FixJ family response regulator